MYIGPAGTYDSYDEYLAACEREQIQFEHDAERGILPESEEYSDGLEDEV